MTNVVRLIEEPYVQIYDQDAPEMHHRIIEVAARGGLVVIAALDLPDRKLARVLLGNPELADVPRAGSMLDQAQLDRRAIRATLSHLAEWSIHFWQGGRFIVDTADFEAKIQDLQERAHRPVALVAICGLRLLFPDNESARARLTDLQRLTVRLRVPVAAWD